MKSHRVPSKYLLLALLIPFSFSASAYTFGPRIVTFRTTGDKSSHFFRLQNREMKVSAVEITVHECQKDLSGKLIQGRDADDEFIIYPAQIILMPGDEIRVQIRWIGEPSLSTEQAYTLVAREVPVPRQVSKELEDSGTRIDITLLVNYEARIYVTPEDARPHVVVESVAEITESTWPDVPAGARQPSMLEVICANRGTTHKKMKTMSLVLMPLDEHGEPMERDAVTLTLDDLPALKTNLLAGGRRRFVFTRPAALPPGSITAILNE